MVGLLSAALLLAAAQDSGSLTAPDWSAALAQAEALAAEVDPAQRRARAASLQARASAGGEDPNARLLEALVARALGAEERTLVLEPAELARLDAEGCRLAAPVLVAGELTDAALLRALDELPDERVSLVFAEAYARFVEHDSAYRIEIAARLAAASHARASTGWSAANLASVLRRAGRFDEAERALTEQLARAADQAERVALLQDRALVHLGAGREAAARADLGAAVAEGSPDAGVVLGRMALFEGRAGRARAVLRPLLGGEAPQAWALRGWGLSMLPTARGRL